MIYQEFYKFVINNKLIDSKYITLLIENYIKENNLEEFYKETIFDFNSKYMAAYLIKEKK